ncbi:TraB/TrbI/VirB10 family type IV secretion system protein [Wolbachia endosymbiont of Ctenocephalides felis wCfeJ]|uniref:TrbI/VirB10 family protein n=1 Tax=Wolbachia endosymbiont of Ctenocephalides felis wCfeJ TaxID=2732594 RepID=UPI0014481C2D|nr:TrbI/VirB10 family protein [Wolbachia endosymbiont of Ctenocephalides felis wCfeJ]WCR57533.1 MAG: Type IV secretion system protein virB10 [Wolbachia endosymbiont of Ctenocephalides felis wCfeJ]
MNKEKRNNSGTESEIESKVVTVGSNQSHRALMVIILVLLVGGIYYLYFSPSSDEEDVEIVKKEETKQNVQELKEKLEKVPDDVVVHERMITDLPSLPPLSTPKVIPEVKQTKKEEAVKKEEEKPKETPVSNIPVLPKQNLPYSNVTNNLPTSLPGIGSGGYPRDRRGAQMLAISGGVEENKAADTILSNTSVQPSIATKVGKLGLMITQGKIIDAVLETAINSDLQGTLRAVVSSNVYAETGDTVLIPRGSRLIGKYSFDSNVARARINIIWNRIILPHGIDIAISSPGTDELGRAGVAGIIDNKIASALFSSILLAGVSVGSAVIAQKASNLIDVFTIMDAVRSITATEIDISPLKDIIGKRDAKNAENDKWKLGLGAIRKIKNAPDEQSLVRTFRQEVKDLRLNAIDDDGVDKITLEDIKLLLKQRGGKSVYEEAIGKSIEDFSKDMRDIVNRYTDKKPTAYVDQGTALKVFVNQDIVFPPQAILNR